MKKKFVTLLLVLTCTASLVGCAAKEEAEETTVVVTEESTEEVEKTTTEVPVETETVESTEEVTEETTEADGEGLTATVNTPSELSDDLYSFQVSVDGTVYQVPMWAKDFQALGWSYKGDLDATLDANQYSVADRWEKDGVTFYTKMANLSMNTVSIGESMVGSLTIDTYNVDDAGWEIILPKGIQLNVSTEEDIVEAYGEPSYEYDGDSIHTFEYQYDYHQTVTLSVYKDMGVLGKIEIDNIVELEGADNSVSEAVPEQVSSYKAPASIGDDLYAFNMELEGTLISLPCPVSELLAHGFTINEENSDSAFGAGSFGWVELRSNNQSYRCIVQNYADYATTAENCFVTTMKSSEYGPKFDLTIPCGIKVGTSEEELLEILQNFEYEVEESGGSFTYYTIQAPDASIWENYEISVTEGKVTIIEVTNTIDL